MNHSPRPRKKAKLPESLHHRLCTYVDAARANALKNWDRSSALGALTLAGASALVALGDATPALARIIYTPRHVVMSGGSDVYYFALNVIGGHDFRLQIQAHALYGDLSILGAATGARILGKPIGTFGYIASALKPGTRVGPKSKVNVHNGFMAGWQAYGTSQHQTCRPNKSFPWDDVKNRYLGLRFLINGKAHYGWARLNVSVKVQSFCTLAATLTGYAYETIPNKAIITGKTKGPDVIVNHATLGELALGKK
jgi:hypothetical protein